MPDDDKLNSEDKSMSIPSDDGQPPFSAPTDVPGAQPQDATHPNTDSDVDETEAYQDGTNAAAGIRQEDEHPHEDDHGTRVA
ncbi:MAG TPA: hypothetical protein VLH84_05500 [Patescibacteria group bacterium]|nr:hypothetical protein [Patescibacteria group bacterium]